MAILNWNEQLVLGIESVDTQHKHLVGLINELDESLAIGAERDALVKIVDSLIDYTVYHFDHEEQLMKEADFNPTIYAIHEAEHKEFVAEIIKVQFNVRDDIGALSDELME